MPGSSEDAYDATIRATAGTRSVTGLLTVEPALRDLAIEQISGTDTATLVVRLTGRTRTAATVVLSADDAGTLDLPQEVTVPAGASAATVSVAISRHSWDAAVDVTATLGARAVTTSTSVDRYFQAGDSYVVDEPTLAPADENGGVRGVLHLTLDHPVGGEGLEVVDDRALRYDIPVGAESVDLPVYLTPYPVDSQVTATFTLLTGRGTVIDYRDVSFRVHPSVAAVSAPDPVVVGQPGTGRVSLIAASAVDETVVLSGAGLTVPDSVTVPAGETTATFPVSAPAAGTGSIRASVRGVATTSTPVAVGAAIPDECRPTAVEVPADVYASPDYDEPLLYPATVELGCTAPTELLVPLTVDDDTDRLYVGMPTFARVAAGESSGDFMLSVLGGGACGSFRCTPARDVVLSAGVGDLSLDRTVTIKPGLSTFRGEIDPATGRYALRIWMTGQAAGNTFVDISTDDPEILIFPARTAIPTGARSLLVPSVSDSIPDEGAVVGITVSIGPVVQHYLVGVHR